MRLIVITELPFAIHLIILLIVNERSCIGKRNQNTASKVDEFDYHSWKLELIINSAQLGCL